MTAVIRRRVVVTGTVQGVFFRATCGAQAQARDVAGWVSNSPDGSVEAVFEGGDAAVNAMIDWAHRGPLSAKTGSPSRNVMQVGRQSNQPA